MNLVEAAKNSAVSVPPPPSMMSWPPLPSKVSLPDVPVRVFDQEVPEITDPDEVVRSTVLSVNCAFSTLVRVAVS